MPEYLRVKDKAAPNHKYTIVAAALDPEAQQVLKQDAVDVAGNPLPPEFSDSASNPPSK